MGSLRRAIAHFSAWAPSPHLHKRLVRIRVPPFTAHHIARVPSTSRACSVRQGARAVKSHGPLFPTCAIQSRSCGCFLHTAPQ